MDWFSFLQSVGPYSAPINILLMGALWWMNSERGKVWKRHDDVVAALTLAQADAFAYRDKRANELQAAAREYAQYGREMAEANARDGDATREILRTVREGVMRLLDRPRTEAP